MLHVVASVVLRVVLLWSLLSLTSNSKSRNPCKLNGNELRLTKTTFKVEFKSLKAWKFITLIPTFAYFAIEFRNVLVISHLLYLTPWVLRHDKVHVTDTQCSCAITFLATF